MTGAGVGLAGTLAATPAAGRSPGHGPGGGPARRAAAADRPGVGGRGAVTAYLIETIGPALDWPDLVLAVSPFHHLAAVPAEPFELAAALVMTVAAIVLAAAGCLLFEHRDLTGD
ncbi:hypothetical protein [Actinomadura sp. 3N508]|uniref:hypothetical protein n=1 Tax=Actinomadura sp. 3N508 TaxID=3375153 RepID=UPI0037AF9C5B